MRSSSADRPAPHNSPSRKNERCKTIANGDGRRELHSSMTSQRSTNARDHPDLEYCGLPLLRPRWGSRFVRGKRQHMNRNFDPRDAGLGRPKKDRLSLGGSCLSSATCGAASGGEPLRPHRFGFLQKLVHGTPHCGAPGASKSRRPAVGCRAAEVRRAEYRESGLPF